LTSIYQTVKLLA